MFKYLKYSITIIFSLMILVLLTAFGCKKQEDSTGSSDSQTSVDSTEQITYNQIEPDNTVATENSQITDSNADNTGNQDNSIQNNEDTLFLEKAEKLAEIFGTFTNKDKEAYKNLKDLKQYSNDKLVKWIDDKSKMPIDSSTPFYGMTTSALSSVFISQDSSKSKILVTVKREEITASSNTPKVSYKIILTTFEKSGEDWKLSGIYWQD